MNEDFSLGYSDEPDEVIVACKENTTVFRIVSFPCSIALVFFAW